MITYFFDGSFCGLLTAVFESYALKHRDVRLCTLGEYQPAIFDACQEIKSDEEKAHRVWKGMGGKLERGQLYKFYTAFLSESADAFRHMFAYARYVFDTGGENALNFGNEHVLAVENYAKKVSRERHRMKAFVRFQKAANGLYFAVIEPDFNVLPLIAKHFTDRYADQPWLIFDRRRHSGIYYDLTSIREVKVDTTQAGTHSMAIASEMLPDENEHLYTSLWQEYFKSTNIKERANLKLHLQHVPRRYWKYLPEKGLGLF